MGPQMDELEKGLNKQMEVFDDMNRWAMYIMKRISTQIVRWWNRSTLPFKVMFIYQD